MGSLITPLTIVDKIWAVANSGAALNLEKAFGETVPLIDEWKASIN